MSELHVCQLQLFYGIKNETCGTCYHAYPHKHKKNCNGNHCKRSNIWADNIKDYLTCQPLVDTKEDPIVISNVKYAEGVKYERTH